jgi:uncharacterized protein YkwD
VNPRALLITAATALALLAAAPASTPAASNSGIAQRAQALELAIGREMNVIRSQHGLRQLAGSTQLRSAASSHSKAMLDQGFFAHESPDGTQFSERLRRFYPARSGYWTVGENLAMVGSAEPAARELVGMWMASPHHRSNLLDPNWREFGLGVRFSPSAQGTFGGMATWVVTLDFGSRRP